MHNGQPPTEFASGEPAGTSPHPNVAHISALIESANDPIWSVDLDYRLITFNQAFSDGVKDNFGIAAKEGMAPVEYLPVESAISWSQMYQQAMVEGITRLESEFFDGRIREFSLNPIILGGLAAGVSVFGKDITERKEAELAIREREEQFRTTFELAPIGIVHQSPEGEWLRCNDKFCQIVGYTQDELFHRTFRELTAPADRDESEWYRKRLLSREIDTACFEKRYVRKNGTIVWVEITVTLQRDKHGKPLRFIVLIADITSRRLADDKLAAMQENLRVSEERYRATFDQAGMGIVHTSFDGQILRCNERFAQMLGYSREDIARFGCRQLTHPDDVKASKSAFDRVINGQFDAVRTEKRFLRKDGTVIWAGATISVQFDADGRPLHCISLVEDIDARRRAEEKLLTIQECLHSSEIRYRTIFETSTDSICLIRLRDLKYIEVNRAFAENTGYAREEVTGRTPQELSIWANPEDQADLLDMLQRQGEIRNVEIEYRKSNGGSLCGLTSASIIEIDQEPCVLAIIRDITDSKVAKEAINNLAFFDSLTGLPNRRLVLERLHQTLPTGSQRTDTQALLFVDLDNFKAINDALGHGFGDHLLREVAGRLSLCVRQTDTVARLSGDEFVVILGALSRNGEKAAAEAEGVARKVLSAIDQPYLLNEHRYSSTACIGIAMFGRDRKSVDEVLRHAEIAMFDAKAAGRNTIKFFSPPQQAAIHSRAAMEEDLRHAIDTKQFVLHYQPQFKRGRVIGVEALVRWAHPTRGILLPGEFIPLAEETGLILALGQWVLQSVCEQLAKWAKHKGTASIRVALNISALQLHHPQFVETVRRVVRATGANPRKLSLELTESVLVKNIETAKTKMEQLKSLGCKVSLDDFGTGYSSLSYLKRLPLDYLKIDRSFVRDIAVDKNSMAIARSIVSLSRAMGLSVIAEGVETEQQWNCLQRIGCREFQGFLFSRPVPVDELSPILGGQTRWVAANADLCQDTPSSGGRDSKPSVEMCLETEGAN